MLLCNLRDGSKSKMTSLRRPSSAIGPEIGARSAEYYSEWASLRDGPNSGISVPAPILREGALLAQRFESQACRHLLMALRRVRGRRRCWRRHDVVKGCLVSVEVIAVVIDRAGHRVSVCCGRCADDTIETAAWLQANSRKVVPAAAGTIDFAYARVSWRDGSRIVTSIGSTRVPPRANANALRAQA